MSSVSTSKLKFKKLTIEDIPNVLEITKDIWEWDYLPSVIEEWIKDPKCYAFGAFLESKMVAVANVRFITPKAAWLEGGRVRLDYQKKGFGIELTNHCLEYAKEHGAHVAQYMTINTNIGSITLAHHCGLKQKNEMASFFISSDDHAFDEIKIKEVTGLIQITSNEAFELLKTIPNGPESDLSVGRHFVPFTKELLSEIDGIWFKYKDAIALVLNEEHDHNSQEGGRLSIIIYGEPKSSEELVQGYLYKIRENRITNNIKELRITSPLTLLKGLEELGLKRIRMDRPDSVPRNILLFEKILNE